MDLVEQTKRRSGWPARQTLVHLAVTPASYYRWCRRTAPAAGRSRSPTRGYYELLPSERQAILDYALGHPEVRHRELAFKMLDEGICAVSPSSVYRVLGEADLVCRWKPKVKVKGSGRRLMPSRPDELWQTDIRYVKVGSRNYYLLSFLDVYSRYVVYHELLTCMDGRSIAIAAAEALATLPPGVRPTIQSDHGSGFIAREFAGTLAGAGVGHTLIRPHTPTDNAFIERYHRTIGEQLDQHELNDLTEAKAVIDAIIDQYNHHRLHASLYYLRPADYYRGDPETLLAQRRRKLSQARELRKQENVRLRQRLIPWTGTRTVTYAERRSVSL
jgi:transposase InsO family protein